MKSSRTDKSNTSRQVNSKAPTPRPRRLPAPVDFARVEARAAELAQQEKWKQAARTLMQAAKAEPTQISRWLQIATWQRQTRAPKEAVDILIKALQANGISAHGSARGERAESLPPRAQRAKPQHAPLSEADVAVLWQAMAEAQWDARNWNGCIKACEALLQLQPRSHAAREMLATALLQDGRPTDAMAMMQELLRMSPRDPLHRLRYATLLQLQGRSGDALREFQLVLQLYPDAPFVEDAHEAVEALDAIQIQQILMMAGEQNDFRHGLQQELETVLDDSGFHLSENGRESLRNMLGDGRPDGAVIMPPRVH
ncbi:MAG TPA: tetratricopeptide repeat protein [Abditibacteriaceae bacterium]|jgi:tetratricopeptide (TPR) repeat protein